MKHHPKTRNPDPAYRNPLMSKSFEIAPKRKPSSSHDPKDTIDFNESIEYTKQPSLPKKLANFLQKASRDKPESKGTALGFKFYRYPETHPDTQYSPRSGSGRKLETSPEEMSPTFYMQSKNLQKISKGNSRHSDIHKQGYRSDTINSINRRPPSRENDLSLNKFYFHTYDNRPKAVNATKLANRTFIKYNDESKRQAKSAIRGSVRTSSNPRANKSINKSFCDMEPVEKGRYSPLKRRPSGNEKIEKGTKKKGERAEAPIKNRKSEESKKTKSFLTDYESMTKISDLKDVNGKKLPDLAGLTEKEIMQLETSLLAYYDLLIKRGQTNSKLLLDMKENFMAIMHEFAKKCNKARECDGLKQRYDQEQGKVNKEKELLQLKMNVLKNENDRLKENMRHLKQEDMHVEESLVKSREKSPFSKNIQDALMKEQKLTDLLQQKERVITSLKEKENKYISLLEALGAQGVNVKEIFQEHLQNNHNKSDIKDEVSRIETLPDMMDDNSILLDKSHGETLHITKKVNKRIPTEEDEQAIGNQGRKSSKRSNLENKGSSKNRKDPAVYGHEYWERQFTEASNSKTYSPPSQSVISFQDGAGHQQLKLASNGNKENIVILKEKNVRNEKGEVEGSQELKDKLKLDLSSLQQKMIKQYHDEFMEKWPDFASSWKRAMRKDKTFQHSHDD